MSLSFRRWRRAASPPDLAPSSGSTELDERYRNWRGAGDASRAAEQANGPDRRDLEAVRSGHRLTQRVDRAQIANGWAASDDVPSDLDGDELLVQKGR